MACYLVPVPDWYRDFYNIWFRLGWRPSEIVAVRLGWLDFDRQCKGPGYKTAVSSPKLTAASSAKLTTSGSAKLTRVGSAKLTT